MVASLLSALKVRLHHSWRNIPIALIGRPPTPKQFRQYPLRSGEGLQAAPETSKKSPNLLTNHL